MRILLAEDERALSAALVTILKHSQYSVDAVYDGEDALDYLLSGIYDLAVLDIMMPKRDGISVLKEARAKNIDIPIIMLTAKSQLEDKVAGLDAGADDYITKPFEAKELLARIRAAARRTQAPKESNLSVGNLTLNRAQCTIEAGGKSAKLGFKEFQMLEMLMLSPQSIVSAEKFIEKIWGLDSRAEEGSVWVYLSMLRKKLAQVGANVFIKANRNLGYYLGESDD